MPSARASPEGSPLHAACDRRRRGQRFEAAAERDRNSLSFARGGYHLILAESERGPCDRQTHYRHYKLIVDVPLNEAVVQLVEGVGRSFDSYTIALGACASNASEAASLARDFLGHQHQNANLDIGEVEVSEVPEAQIPTHVLDDAFAPIDEPGIYWASGRIFASGVGGRP